jgi:CRISPR-associated endonuclease/helicase Cas3
VANDTDYASIFCSAFRVDRAPTPYPYQQHLASGVWPDFLDIPTGLGKTAAVTLAWLFKRGWRTGERSGEPDVDTPRRLVWCLPMRVLVEQTEKNIRAWLDNLAILGEAGDGKISVHVLMGGERDLKTWVEYPEEDMILIGTQDMLLSRALMRGYGMSRYQWPVHYALLHNDCLWVFDEVQLMGVGLATSAQIEAFRRAFPLGKTSRSLWLSATLNPEWLRTIDLAPHLSDFSRCELSDADCIQAQDRLNARKILKKSEVTLTADSTSRGGAVAYLQDLCDAVLAAHTADSQTLVIVNRVDRAQGLYRLLRERRGLAQDLLIHARFRPPERRTTERRLEEESAIDRIIVATQAIEAGVDISSKVLFTELAPWASLVQRFGRCNRYGEHNSKGGAQVFWIDVADDAEKLALPYTKESLFAARTKLAHLTAVGPTDLPGVDEPAPLVPVLRRKDLLDLFNTDPDLSGFDVDVSDYIRDSGNPGLQIFWRDVEDPNQPVPQPAPDRDELCPVSIGQAKALRKRKRIAWRWDSLAGSWERLENDPRPGMILLLAAKEGCYDAGLGFTADAKGVVAVSEPTIETRHEHYDADWRSSTRIPVALVDHLGHAARQAQHLCAAVGEKNFSLQVIRADRWHDLGKAHEIFDASMHRCDDAPKGYLAKSNCLGPMRHRRKHFRHELASALSWLSQHDPPGTADAQVDLVAYLIAAHHGKVRMSLRAMPDEKPAPNDARFARGIWEGDVLPALTFDGESSKEVTLRLSLMELGEGKQGRSWTARVLDLLDEHGPFRLAWLETLVRIADWRASAKEQLAHRRDLGENLHHGLETEHSALATTGSRAATPDSPAQHSPEGRPQHGLRGRTGGSADAGTRTATPDHATRQIETSLDVISYAELAPHLALRVEQTAVAIANGEFDDLPLDDNLIRELHGRICGDLTPQFAGRWRNINVLVGTHEPPAAALVALKMRDFAADLHTRIQNLPPQPDDQWLETLAFAEGRLLSVHPFQDFNGRVTRLFLDLLLKRLNLPDIEAIPSYGLPTEEYLAALQAADRYDWQPLVEIWRERLERPSHG